MAWGSIGVDNRGVSVSNSLEWTEAQTGQTTKYPLLTRMTLRLIVAGVLGRPSNFAADARVWASSLAHPIQCTGDPPSAAGGYVLAVNHYCRPGFPAWWIALSVSSLLPMNVHWLMTSTWTYPDAFRSAALTPLLTRLFRRVAAVYDFTLMPPMPPQPSQAQRRADSVRRVLKRVEADSRTAIGLAPEGGDFGSGSLTIPPPGVGRFLSLLGARGLLLQPVGVYEAASRLCVGFGELRPFPATAGSAAVRDRAVADFTMQAVADCLPAALRGAYA